ncbi:hypothetical protein [Streptomyces radicis]|uniref:Uncharacterized protein n=1 Tax=Streptomyces radicis TaxID=1750517 RepID=A0A3A9WBG2_9ACTN|nr:hypothetical protein [Streptomyces radicis]RKN10059.1 hypothetical protein D7319_09770 [Streptomyces radicis]RKN24401.1 hypothetical protein D7318_10950 [Streptomyces radicis]
MTEWVAAFEHPEGGWIPLDMESVNAAEEAAQRIADRGGAENQEYAELVYPELKAIRDGALERGASPVMAFVPETPSPTRPLVVVTVFVAPVDVGEERTLENIARLVRRPREFRYREPLIDEVELPAGQALRVHELVVNEEGDDERRVLMEYVTHYVIVPDYPKGVFEMTVTWASPAIGPELAQTADEMAASLTVSREPGEGEG